MNKDNFETFFDCGFSKVRAGVFNQNNKSKDFYAESEFLKDHFDLKLEIQKIIASFEKETNQYIDNVNLMIDSPKMLSVGISISKKIDGYELKLTNVQFLVQEAKQQILKYYKNYNIAHIIINNYKVDDINYSYLPEELKCHSISLDIVFICLPSDLVINLRNIFLQSNVLVNQITCSSYVKSIHYKDSLKLTGPVSFIDIGFNKTSIITYSNDTIFSLETLPIGGNHITRDISEILKIDMERSEKIKLNFYPNCLILKDENYSQEKLQNIIFARIDEILKLCNKSIHSNSQILGQFKILLMGEGSKIINNELKNKISYLNDMVFFDEKLEEICQSGLKFSKRLNIQEVVVMPKKQIKEGFFEKLFHFFT